FRGALGKEVHQALNGPYPAHSWACSPRVKGQRDGESADPFDPDLAKALAQRPEARKGLGPVPLKLKYPEGDPVLDKALAARRHRRRDPAGAAQHAGPERGRRSHAEL